MGDLSWKVNLDFLDLFIVIVSLLVHGPGGVTMHPPKGSLGVV